LSDTSYTSNAPISSNPQPTRSRWYLLIALVFSVVFLYLAINDINWSEFVSTVFTCRIEYLIPTILIILVNFFIRSQRWGLLVRVNRAVPTNILFWSTGIGYLGNNFLPFRTGEILRSIALGYKSGISKVYIFATALTERVIDTVYLVILGFLLIPSIKIIPGWLPSAMRVIASIAFIAIIFLLLAPHLETTLRNIIGHFKMLVRWQHYIFQSIEQFVGGAAAFRNFSRALIFLFLTCLIWLLDGTGMLLASRAFSIVLSLQEAILLLVGLGLSSAIPSAPGYIGVYQFVAVSILAIYGYQKSQALAFILVVQAISLLLTLIWGLVGMGALGINIQSLDSDRVKFASSYRDVIDG
jgi:uncharacterized protein (TIRG00374 family)